jgi:hypothetical protein
MTGWLGSSGHRANIERSEFRAIGVGVARAANGTHYWAQDFGAFADAAAPPPALAHPPPSPPVASQPLALAVLPPTASGAALRVRRCRRVREHAVACRLGVSWAPVVVRGRLRQRGTVVAAGSVGVGRAGRVRLVMRARPALKAGRATLRMRAGALKLRRAVRVR